jgi:hypothetical protein
LLEPVNFVVKFDSFSFAYMVLAILSIDFINGGL